MAGLNAEKLTQLFNGAPVRAVDVGLFSLAYKMNRDFFETSI
ncbi:MAG: hypothetical protein ACI9S8_002369 [Chlamydiales bacterium]|jgi:hypothetical protein